MEVVQISAAAIPGHSAFVVGLWLHGCIGGRCDRQTSRKFLAVLAKETAVRKEGTPAKMQKKIWYRFGTLVPITFWNTCSYNLLL